MTRQELHALVTDILAIHACPCLPCVNSMSDRAATIMRAVGMVIAEEAAACPSSIPAPTVTGT